MKLYSTLDRKVVEIETIKSGKVSIYNCGPTVYSRMHVGNCRAYVSWDILHRALVYLGYSVERIMNFTDVGHMTEDEDFGEDKIEIAARSSGKDPLDISNYYIKTVLEDFSKLNILTPKGDIIQPEWEVDKLKEQGWLRATDYITEMVDSIKVMEEKGYTYETDLAVYFDITKINDYTIFTGQSLDEKQTASRDSVEEDTNKRNPADFVLWMKRAGKYSNHLMYWSSPWGDGFPGWHIECTAMSLSKLGCEFDIHTGGIDHVSVHHPNERAQNIGVCGKPVVKYWVHNEFIVGSDDDKLSKSKGGALTLPDVIELGYDPLDLRHLFVSVNYRVKLSFSKQALTGARNARLAILGKIDSLKKQSNEKGEVIPEYIERFKRSLEENLNMSESLAILNELLKSSNKSEDILQTVYDFDRVFGLELESTSHTVEIEIPEDVKELLKERESARKNREYDESDRLRDLIQSKGYKVLDTADGQILEKSNE
jgi:cysteinyl-tRNA synthetase